ncbi:MAG: TonB-dependent receptor [Chloroflexi bacterium]|nr:TonB-dependent receptor [Chloroflexota bacterium]
MPFLRPLLLLAVLLCAFHGSAAAQIIQGRVLDAVLLQPIPGATVTLLGGRGQSEGRTTTRPDGTFSLQPRAPGTYRLQGERFGYQASRSDTVAIGVRETIEVVLHLSVEPLQIAPLVVTGRRVPPRTAGLELAGFYERESTGFGRFLRREDFEKLANKDLVQVLMRVPGTRQLGGNVIYFPRSSTAGMIQRSQQGRGTHCLPKVYLDGMAVAYDPRSGINGLASPEMLDAVELYSGASQIPVKYGGSDSACGVILMWTRTSR